MKTLITFFLLITSVCYSQWQPDVRLTTFSTDKRLCFNNAKSIVTQGFDVHLVFSSGNSGVFDVWYMKSTNEGTVWGSLVQVTSSISDAELYPAICLDGLPSPVIHIAWTDDRYRPNWEIYYKRSTNGGLNWLGEIRITDSYSNSLYPSIAASGSNVHIVWDELNDVFYRQSTNGGLSWLGASGGTLLTYGSMPSVAVSGTYIHVAYQRDNEIYYIRSLSNGSSWEPPLRLTNDTAISKNVSISAVGQGINIVWEDNRDGNFEIYYKKSRDGGLNWEPDIRLSNSLSYSSLYPSVFVSGSIIHVSWKDIYYDARLMYKKSLNGGVSWTGDIALTYPVTGDIQNPSVSAFGTKAHIIWVDSRNAVNEIYYKQNPTGNSYIYKYPKYNINKTIGDLQTVYDTLNIGISDFADPVKIAAVKITIDTVLHTNDTDLEFTLIHEGRTDTIIYRAGGSGDNFIVTNLDDSAVTLIGNGTAPFTGTFKPHKPLSVFNNVNADGTWILKIYDRSSGNTGVLKAWTLTIIPQSVIGITPINSELPEQFSLSQNYPNPFNPVTKIKFDIPVGNGRDRSVKLIIYDILGREVATLVNEELKPGTYEVDWSAEGGAEEFSSGVYFYKIIAGDYTETKKMVLMK